MTPQFKFLRRVRIHGGECGAVARALHHEAQKVALIQNEQSLISDECVLLRQAELEKSSNSTLIERKQMSTKTSIKRIALVAVSALGFGLLSVTSANAADTTDAIDAVSITAPMNARVGTDTLLGCSLTETGGTLDSGDTADLAIAFLTDGGKPASSTAADLDVLTDALAEGGTIETRTATVGEYVRFSDFDGSSATSVTMSKCALINADVAGTYKVVLWADQDFDEVLDAGEKSGTVTINTTGAPASFTVTKASPGTAAVSTASDDSSGSAITMEGGTLLKIVPKDSSGNVVRLTSQEYLTLSSSDSSFEFFAVSDTSRSSAITSLAASAQEPDGSFYVNLLSTGSAAETTVATVTGGGAISTTISQTLSVTATAPDATDFATAGNNGTTGSDGYAVTAGTDDTDGTVSSSAITHKVVGIGSGAITAIDVTDTYGFITGKYGAVFSMAATGATSTTATLQKATFPITYALTPKTGETYKIRYLDDDDGAEATLTIASASATHTAAMADSAIRALTASSVTVTATITDAFGNAVAGTAVSFSRTGRNATSSATTVLTNADGEASLTYTDAGTTGSSDTVTATPTGGTSTNTAASTTVTWLSDLAVSTVVLTGGNTTAGVTATTVTNKDIDAGADGASTTTYSITATVKDANGSVLVGAPVAWTVDGTTAAFLSTSQTTYTDSTGVATGSIYGWVAGTYTVTATSGGKTGTATITFAQTTTTEARTISASVEGPIVTSTVKDRFGNPINGVTVYATKSGSGYFGSGVTSTNGTTNSQGVVEFTIAGGNADVTVSLVDPSAVAGTTFGQSCAVKGDADCDTTPTALTAYTAGTSRTAEDGVGASFDAAGVASVTVAVTGGNAAVEAAEAATDAASEAIDAANAATDAANLAAEAADAATVAAEEARDAADAATAAVEELATQVATLMAALKAQITTLANTVAKIAKKVKA